MMMQPLRPLSSVLSSYQDMEGLESRHQQKLREALQKGMTLETKVRSWPNSPKGCL